MDLSKYRNILNEVQIEHNDSVNRNRNTKVLVIDSLNTFIRSWTTNPTMDSNGDHIGGIVGFLKSVGFIIRQQNPTRVILVFDGKKGSAARKGVYEGYKSDRGVNRFRVNRQYPDMMSKDDEDISMKRQLLALIDILHHLPITTMIYDGIEADDVIAYISTKLISEGSESVIVSTDKDFLQLIDEHTKVYSPTKKILYEPDVVYNEYGIYPQNFPIYRSMDGDSSDSVPGIKGCGLKTIIKRFPEITDRTKLSLDEFITLCEEKSKTQSYKIYDEILNNSDILKRNFKLMQLQDVDIPNDYKLKIISRFDEQTKQIDKLTILKLALKYKISNNWPNFDSWLKDTFSGIIHE